MPTRRAIIRVLTAGAAACLTLSACTDGDEDGAGVDAPAAQGDDAPAAQGDDAPAAQGDDAPAAQEDGAAADDPDDRPATGDGATDALASLTATTPDGDTITLGDHAGSPVLVETFATWCSTCRSQLGETQAAAAEAGDDAVFLALSVETDLDPATLDQYAAENGFEDVVFAVLEDDGLATLQQRFGGAVLVPPSTPKFRVAADGTVSELTTGRETAEELLASLDT